MEIVQALIQFPIKWWRDKFDVLQFGTGIIKLEIVCGFQVCEDRNQRPFALLGTYITPGQENKEKI
jgi:hypothetical protein